MKKKLLAIILSALTFFASVSLAGAEDNKVEISFKVGDSILLINGVETEVETPYIAGDGTTLVPLRVITEAFGAEVDWEGETQTITLAYPDVNITLQIGNILATVNDHSEQLLEAPALSENGVTMVPLRFISETFGATVSYDNDTQAILVTKEKVGDAQTVIGVTDMSRTGDSYYKWSIDTPAQMKMTDRRPDGLCTIFTADDGSAMHIDLYKNTKDSLTPFDERFTEIKDSFKSYTLTEADKLTDPSGHQYMHFQAKDKEKTIDYREYYADGYLTYEVVSSIKNTEDVSTKNMMLSIADSFVIGSIDKSNTYDLSNVEDDMRTIDVDEYKMSFQIPADFIQSAVDQTENEMRFYSPDEDSNAYVAVGIYSKSSEITAQKLADKDRLGRIKIMNPEFSTVSDVIRSEDGRYSYTHQIKGSTHDDEYLIDTFFEKGDYVYNISAAVNSLDEAYKASAIIASLKTEELDSSAVGKILRNSPDTETMISRNVGKYNFSLPASWKSTNISSSASSLTTDAFMNIQTGSLISVILSTDANYTKGSISAAANDYKDYVTKEKNNSLVSDIEFSNYNGKRYARFIYKTVSDEGHVTYSTVYIKTAAKELLMITLHDDDIYYQKDGNTDMINMLNSLEEK